MQSRFGGTALSSVLKPHEPGGAGPYKSDEGKPTTARHVTAREECTRLQYSAGENYGQYWYEVLYL